MRDFRLFVSSPGDALVERQRTEAVVSRLNGEFAGLARFITIRWETEFYRADATFQAQIPPAADCDIVVGILRWRLGTELPPDFAGRLPGGEPYPSGTAYEILTAVEKRKAGGELPDVFVFKFSESPSIRIDGSDRERVERDWTALRSFFERWFVSREGHFLAALNQYSSEDQFETQLEILLRNWLAQQVAGGRIVPWPATKGSPFCGLGVFGARHAPVFFGRTADIRKAVELWRDAAAREAPFLLVVGASGAGKSSLARAGLIPRLTTAGVIAGVDAWRVAVVRPGDRPDRPFAALATALLEAEADLPPGERGRGAALPEIAEGDNKTPADLASVLAHADAGAVRPVVNALSRIGERLRESGRFDRTLRCDLVLLVDQLDELFAQSIAADTRARFAELLAALVATRRVWILATLRADFYAAMLDVPALKGLKDAGASYDLAPPGAAELAEIVREPAKAAALTFERDPVTGEALDERLLREADRPDMLPLVQLALSRLWEARQTRGGETLLPLAAFQALGGVRGIVAEAGEAALAPLPEVARDGLAPLIRQLAERSHAAGAADSVTARAVPIAAAAPQAEARRLLDALVGARLLTLFGEGGATTVRLSHQRVLSDWPRAAAIVAESADFYRVRDEVEEQRRRWEAGRRRGELLLARGLPLAEARAMQGKYGPELPAPMHAFIAASRRRANRAQTIGWGLAGLFAVLAIGAGVGAKVAVDQTARAEAERRRTEEEKIRAEVARRDAEAQRAIASRNFAAAKRAVDGLIFDIVQGLRDVAGMRVETVRTILETTRQTVDRLASSAPDDLELLRSRATMLINFAKTYLAAGAAGDASKAAEDSLAIFRRLYERDTGNSRAQRELAIALSSVGDVNLSAGNRLRASAVYREAIAIVRQRAQAQPDDPEAQQDLAAMLARMGVVEGQTGSQTGAFESYEKSLALYQALAEKNPDDPEAQSRLSTALSNLADAKLKAGDRAGAIAAYEKSLAIERKLVALNPGDRSARRHLSRALANLGEVRLQGGDPASALAAYEEGLRIDRKLAQEDPGDAEARASVASDLSRIGNVRLQVYFDRDGALTAFKESLGLRRDLAKGSPVTSESRRDLAASLNEVGEVKLQVGDVAGAIEAFAESLDILGKRAAVDAGNADAQREYAYALNSMGDARARAGDRAGALLVYEEALRIRRKRADAQPGNVGARRDVAISAGAIGDLKLDSDDTAGAITAYDESATILGALAEKDGGNARAQRDAAISLNRLGDAKSKAGDQPGAMTTFKRALAIFRKLVAQTPEDTLALGDVAAALDKIGDAKLQAADKDGALDAYTSSLSIRRKILDAGPTNLQSLADVATSLDKVGDAKMDTQDTGGALENYRQSLNIRRAVMAKAPYDHKARLNAVVTLYKLGSLALLSGDRAGGLEALEEGAAIARELAARPDLDHAKPLLDLAIIEGKVGDAKLAAGDAQGALAAFTESLTARRKMALAAPDDDDAQLQLAISLTKLAPAQQAASDTAGALGSYDEARVRLNKLGARRVEALRRLFIVLESMAELKLKSGDKRGAITAYEESLAGWRGLAARGRDPTEGLVDVRIALVTLGDAKMQTGDAVGAVAAYAEVVDIDRRLSNPADADTQRTQAIDLATLGKAKFSVHDNAGALTAFEQSLVLRRAMAARAVTSTKAALDLLRGLVNLAEAKDKTGDRGGALALWGEGLEVARHFAEVDRKVVPAGAADIVGGMSYDLLFAREFEKARLAAELAGKLGASLSIAEANRAHALMLLGRTAEARDIYLRYRGKKAEGDTPWERTVLADFEALRKAALTAPLMDEIERAFAQPT